MADQAPLALFTTKDTKGAQAFVAKLRTTCVGLRGIMHGETLLTVNTEQSKI